MVLMTGGQTKEGAPVKKEEPEKATVAGKVKETIEKVPLVENKEKAKPQKKNPSARLRAKISPFGRLFSILSMTLLRA